MATVYAPDPTRDRAAERIAEESFIEGLYDTYAQSLFRYAYAITRSAEDAEDALQEVFGKISADRKRAARIQSVSAYLFRAVRNASYSILRSRNRRGEVSEDWDNLECVACSDSADGVIESQVTREAFAALPVEQREVLTLKVYDQMTFSEIAQATGASINTITSRYRYGIEKLRQALEVDDGR